MRNSSGISELNESWLIFHSFKLAALKLCSPSKAHLEEHYKDLAGKPFYPGLVACELPVIVKLCRSCIHANIKLDMLSGPIAAMVWEGRDVVKTGRSKFYFRLSDFRLSDTNCL